MSSNCLVFHTSVKLCIIYTFKCINILRLYIIAYTQKDLLHTLNILFSIEMII